MSNIQELTAKIQVRAYVRYWEDSSINGVSDTEDGNNIPCKDGDFWMPLINAKTGVIENWENGKTAHISYKVCDCCSWDFINTDGKSIQSVHDEYVPDWLSPSEDGYGDYICMDIDESGKIEHWNFKITDI